MNGTMIMTVLMLTADDDCDKRDEAKEGGG